MGSAYATHAEDRYWDRIGTQYFVLTTQSVLDSVRAQVDIVIQCLRRLGNKDNPASDPRERLPHLYVKCSSCFGRADDVPQGILAT